MTVSQPPLKHASQTLIGVVRVISTVALNGVQLVMRHTQLETETPPLGRHWKIC